jgi:hypothetical protein
MESQELDESLKKVEEALHEMHDVEKREQWLMWLSLSTTIIAVTAAIIGLFEGQMASRTITEKNTAILFQSRASDQWSYYQAKSIKGHIYDVNSQLFPSKAVEFKAMAQKYETEKKEIKEKAEGFEKQSEEKNKASDFYYEKHHVFAFAVTFMQISIAIASIAAINRSRKVWYFSLSGATVGILIFLYGFFFIAE